MVKFKTGYRWFDKLVPQGLPVPSSTVVSGEGGSGKPLIGFSMVSSWLENHGNLIFILTNTGKDFVEKAMGKIYEMNIKDYEENLKFIEFDPSVNPTVNSIEKSKTGQIKANIVSPEVWDEAIKMADRQLKKKSELGTLVFASALNLFLFSRTFGGKILEKLREIIEEDKTKTYFFAVSTSAFRGKIKILEDAADNLMFTRAERPMKLFLKVTKVKDVDFSKEETEVPLKTEDLKTIKELAEQSRTDLIPTISKI